MKRSNIFMLSYITFILIGVIVRMFFDFFLWKPLVLAITVSSIFFSVENLFISFRETYNTSNKIYVDHVQLYKQNIEYSWGINNKIDGYIAQHNKEKRKVSVSEQLEKRYLFYVENQKSIKDIIKQLENSVTKMEDGIRTLDNKAKLYSRLASICSYIGFLALFCILIFVSLVDVPIIAQDMITVVSFAIILITQEVDDRHKKSVADEEAEFKEDNELVNKANSAGMSYLEEFESIMQAMHECEKVT